MKSALIAAIAFPLLVLSVAAQGENSQNGPGPACKVLASSSSNSLKVCAVRIAMNTTINPDVSIFQVTGYLINDGPGVWYKTFSALTLFDGKGALQANAIDTRDLQTFDMKPGERYDFTEKFTAGDMQKRDPRLFRADVKVKPKETFFSAKDEASFLSAARQKSSRDAAVRLAVQQSKAAELQCSCAEVFAATSAKKVVDLTVMEVQSIDACRALRLYKRGSPTLVAPAAKIQ